MDVEITPEPPDDHRSAIVAALAEPDGAGPGGAWWHAGVAESVGEDSPGGGSPG